MRPPLTTGTGYILWLAGLVGFCGIHRFYARRWVSGVIWLLTGGLAFWSDRRLFLVDNLIDEANRERRWQINTPATVPVMKAASEPPMTARMDRSARSPMFRRYHADSAERIPILAKLATRRARSWR